ILKTPSTKMLRVFFYAWRKVKIEMMKRKKKAIWHNYFRGAFIEMDVIHAFHAIEARCTLC
ncbi:hypothetical protein, partial [Acinetobacter bereziniae]|uniref:hypothetical protein n=1 Tax=Acinetobacter bereziniae TaxID=106648 RepID=UPI00066540E4